jgi:hypothetical protein
MLEASLSWTSLTFKIQEAADNPHRLAAQNDLEERLDFRINLQSYESCVLVTFVCSDEMKAFLLSLATSIRLGPQEISLRDVRHQEPSSFKQAPPPNRERKSESLTWHQQLGTSLVVLKWHWEQVEGTCGHDSNGAYEYDKRTPLPN